MKEFNDTEIGKIPSDWEVGYFNVDLKVQGRIGWKGYKTSDLVEDGPFVIGGAEIKSKVFLDLENAQHLSREKYIESPEIMLKDQDVLLVTRGNLGEVGFYDGSHGEATINPSVIILNHFIGDSKFLFYYLISRQGNANVMSLASGSSVPAIYQADVKKLKYPKPKVEEQKRISEVPFSIDLKIDLLSRQNKTLEGLAETLFRQWFIEEADESWEEKKLGDLLTITSSKRIYYSEYVTSGIPFYRSKEIIELRETGSTNSELYISSERFKEIKDKFGSPKEGDILMTSVGTLGVAYRVRKSDEFYFKDGNLTWFKDFKGLPSSIVYLWLISNIGQEALESIKIGSTQEALTIEGLKSISFKIPPKECIKKYEYEFQIIINKIEFNHNQIRTLTQLRDTLLPKLMSGEVRVEV